MTAGRRFMAWAAVAAVAVLTGVLILIGVLRDQHPLSTLAPAGVKARQINELIFPVFIIAGIVFFLVQGAVLYMAFRFRSANGNGEADGEDEADDDEDGGIYGHEEFPDQIHGNTRLEVLWTILPALLLAVIGVFSVIAVFNLTEVEAAEDDLKITVVGQQWWWEYHYHLDGDTSTPPDFVNAGEVVIPAGQEIELEVTARDVIHSFWIPKLHGKRDAVPGRSSPWVIQADEPGRYAGQCTEFCGLSHGFMRMYAISLTQADWDQWAANQMLERTPFTEGEPGFEGQELFIQQCAACHIVVGVTERDRDGDGTPEVDTWDMYLGADAVIGDNQTSGAAPNLTHLASRTTYAGSIFDLYVDRAQDVPYVDVAELGRLDRPQLEAWLRDAPAEKPMAPDDNRGMPDLGLGEDQIDLLIDYLTRLD